MIPRGKGTLFESKQPIPAKDIPDGAENTLMLVEVQEEESVVWTKPADFEYDPKSPEPILKRLKGPGSRALLADGHHIRLPDELDEKTLRAMLSPAGGEKPPANLKRDQRFDEENALFEPAFFYVIGESEKKMEKIAAALNKNRKETGILSSPAITDAEGRPLLSWRVRLLPLLGHQKLFEQFKVDEPWDSPHNRKLVSAMPPIYSRPIGPSAGKTNYLLPIGPHTLFPNQTTSRPRKESADSERGVMLVEVNDDQAVTWTEPRDFHWDESQPREGLVGNYPDQSENRVEFLVAEADGSVSSVDFSDSDESISELFRGYPDPATEKANSVTVETPPELPIQLEIADWPSIQKVIASEKEEGKVVVVDFWASWCERHLAEFPRLVQLQAKYGDRLACISVNLDYGGRKPVESYRDQAVSFLQKNRAGFRHFISKTPDEAFLKQAGLPAIPSVFLYDADGQCTKIAPKGQGDDEDGDAWVSYEKQVEPLVEKLLSPPSGKK